MEELSCLLLQELKYLWDGFASFGMAVKCGRIEIAVGGVIVCCDNVEIAQGQQLPLEWLIVHL